jgi:hypothetical protein
LGRSEIIKFIILELLFHALEKSIGIPPAFNCNVALMPIDPDFAVGRFSKPPISNEFFHDERRIVERARKKHSLSLLLLKHLGITIVTFTFLSLCSNSSEVAYCKPSDE